MIKSRIQKLEKNLPIDSNPLKKFSNSQIDELYEKLKFDVYEEMVDRKAAQEFKSIFIDLPNPLKLTNREDIEPKKALEILQKRRDWDLSQENTREGKERVLNLYAKSREIFKFLYRI